MGSNNSAAARPQRHMALNGNYKVVLVGPDGSGKTSLHYALSGRSTTELPALAGKSGSLIFLKIKRDLR
jgi:GTPase SAR1 family protein